MSSARPIVFYDISMRAPVEKNCCSPNPWKTRLALNFKDLPYSTSWVALPDVSKVRKGLNVPACRKFADGTDFFTLPIIEDPSANTTVGDSFDIAVYLQQTYPNAGAGDLLPPITLDYVFKPDFDILVPLSECRDGEFAEYSKFNANVDAAFTTHTQLALQHFPFDPATADASKAEFVRRAGVTSWEDFALVGEQREKTMESFRNTLGGLAKVFLKDTNGPFILGAKACYADMIVGAWLRMMAATLPESEWEEPSQLDYVPDSYVSRLKATVMVDIHNPAISSASRSKLNSFRYTDAPHMSSKSDGESNGASELENDPPPAVKLAKECDDKENSDPEIRETKPEFTCPQTPAHRIPFSDLISNTEDALNKAPGATTTPDDHVYWDHRTSSTKNKSRLSTRRGKKRHHSSSPAGSPSGNAIPADLSCIQSILKTPQQDIAADLWNKYVGKHGELPGGEPPKFHFSHLASSPQSPAPRIRTSKDGSGLRRANSCNMYWPTSNCKRRKVDLDQQRKDSICDGFEGSRSSLLAPDRPKSSKIGLLVGKIQETLLKYPRDDPDAPSSSSPMPDRSDTLDNIGHPIATETLLQNQPVTPCKCIADSRHDISLVNDAIDDQEKCGSSEFGDDDLDRDFLAFTVNSPKKLFSPRAPSPELEKEMLNNIPTLRPVEPLPPDPKDIPLPELGSFDDDFDDLDDGIEEIMAQYDENDLSNGQTKATENIIETSELHETMGNVKDEIPNEDVKLNESTTYSTDDEFDDDIEFEAIEEAMRVNTGVNATSSQHTKYSHNFKRCLVLDHAENTYTEANRGPKLEKVLFVQEERSRKNGAIILRESWFDTSFEKDIYVHLIGDFDSSGQCIVDNDNNLIIIHPDTLISATVVADSFSCQRRAVLQDRIKATSEASGPQVYGHILHEIFQEAMKANNWSETWLNDLISRVINKYLESLYQIRVEPEEAVAHLLPKIPALKAWAETFLHYQPNAKSLIEDIAGTKSQLCINKLLEVEEHVWSPMYGLKGNIDATVQAVLQEGTEQKTLTVPLELKTGRNNTNEAHRAQTALYTLLLSDRYDIDVSFGVLYYLEASKTLRVRAPLPQIREMIQQRNRLAVYIQKRLELPPMAKKSWLCKNCYAKPSCFVYHKLVENGDENTSGVGKDFSELVGHLTPSHQSFFKKWDLLLTQEEGDMTKFRKELWTMLSPEREAVGRCFSKVVIEPGSAFEDTDGPKINRFQYTFVKHKGSPGYSFTDSQINVGEPIVVSDEKGHFALANGYVVQLSSRKLTVSVDRKLHNARTKTAGFDAIQNQSYVGIMEVGGFGPEAIDEEEATLYRVDKDEFSNGMATVRNNLVCMMDKMLFRSRELRDLIIDGANPSFQPLSSIPNLPTLEQATLNVDQKKAIEKVMSANDYALVLGMPGTGKTTTIAQIIRAIVSQGKSVLLTSYTHTAVDNILLKIRNDSFRVLRLGVPAKIHPEVQKFAKLAGLPQLSIDDLKNSYENSQVVATTCLGINHPIFNSRAFDYCIVDEASQITLPVCLGPIRMAKTFILVGDHYQLPPLVQNKEAREGGLDISLFKLLCDVHPESVVNLEHQYRMCEDIMLLSNTLIYSGHLKCGTPEVASRSLKVPDIDALKQHHMRPLTVSPTQSPCLGRSHGRCWLRDLLEPGAKARLVNTDFLKPAATESSNGARIVNPVEATLCTQLVEALISTGISPQDIGVVTLYRSQLALLRQKLRHRLPDLEMHTADRFQGRDKEIIIMSCVRSNADNNVGDLLRDWHRVNVAFTRARTKLLIVGSKTTLCEGSELLRKFVELMDGRGWCYNLPLTAVESHIFEEQAFTQASPQKSRKLSVSPKKSSPMKKGIVKQRPRTALSPVKSRGNIFASLIRKPEKVGGKMAHAASMIEKKPVMRDVYNDMFDDESVFFGL
ncbi:DNA replication endonuclease-helicase Dna2 [Ophidiomyces ophidiicola]|nr:DNA replication endonuclease-helicase Dna2 [Ophidiomyces ophidiicola]